MYKILLLASTFFTGVVAQCQVFKPEDMTLFDSLRHMSIVKTTLTPCPEIHVELIDDKLMRTKFNEQLTWLTMDHGLRWPANATVYTDGAFEVTFRKKRHHYWQKDWIRKENASDIRLGNVYPNYRVMEVVGNTQITHNTCLLSIRYVSEVYNFFGVGRHFTVRQKIRGKERKHQYTPVPMLPIQNPNIPNAGPGKWFFTNEPIHTIVKTYPNGTLSKWLCSREIGNSLVISKPQGTFCPTTDMKGKTQINLIAAGTGVTPMLSVILWVLQTTRKTKVHLIFFNRHEEDILWRKEIDQTTYVDERFTVEYVLTRPNETWTGRSGRISLEMLKDSFPVYDNTNKTRFTFFGVCGHCNFSLTTAKWLREDMGYPERDVYTFRGQ